ncbi:MAG: M23 family metallopeptidase [Rickettsiales bacterium]
MKNIFFPLVALVVIGACSQPVSDASVSFGKGASRMEGAREDNVSPPNSPPPSRSTGVSGKDLTPVPQNGAAAFPNKPALGVKDDKRARLAANAGAQIRPTSLIVSKKNTPSSAVAALREGAFASGEGQVRPASFSGPAPAALSSDFVWPVRQGKVTSAFGPKKGGLYNEGVNISANKGEPVLAAADGEVVYSGNELRGYGNLILIKHPNGYITTYAHNNGNAVTKGDAVRRGQIIGTVGDSGNVSSPQLHFSIREGKNAVDPGKFFRSSTETRF